MPDIKDFTKQRKELPFKIDGDIFHAVPAIPGETLLQFAKQFTASIADDADIDEQLRAFKDILELVLLPESLERMTARLQDKANPIELDQIADVVMWLFGEYGLRPTEMPSPSPSGQVNPVPGIISMGSTPATASTFAASPQTSS